MAHAVFVMRKPAELIRSAEDMRRLNELLHAPPTHLSEEKMRHLKILRALYRGESGASIADAERITPQRVSMIRKEAADYTLKAVLDRLTNPKNRSKKELPSKRPHAGRPGYEHFDQWAEAIKVDDEAVFELSTLILTREIQVATLSIRIGKLCDYKETRKNKKNTDSLLKAEAIKMEREAKRVSDAWSIPVFWTRASMLDTMLQKVFHRLNHGLDRLMEEKESCSEFPIARSLKERFGSRFFHIVLSGGSKDACNKVVSELTMGSRSIHVRANPKVGLSKHLEAVLHHRRMTRSCTGLLPMTFCLFEHVRKLHLSGTTEPLLWEVKEREVLSLLKVHVIAQDYFAAQGVLLGMSSYLWPKVPYQDEIQFRTLPVTTRVEVGKEISSGFYRVLVRPLPGMEYRIWVPWQGSKKEFEKHARKMLRSEPDSRRFVYSTRKYSLGGARTQIVVPDDFLIKGDETKVRVDTGVVLFPRHFLTPEPAFPLERLASFANKVGESAGVFQVDDNQIGQSILFHAPYVTENLLQSVEDGFFWDHFTALERWQTSISDCDGNTGGSKGVAYSEILLEVRPEAILEEDAWDKFMENEDHATVESLLEQCRKAEEGKTFGEPLQPKDIQRLLTEKVIPRLTAKALRNPETLLEANDSIRTPGGLESLSQSIMALERIMGADVSESNISQKKKRENPSVRNPVIADIFDQLRPHLLDELMALRETKQPDVRRDFEKILQQVDADYLLRSLNADTREKLEKDAAEWARSCEQMVATEYWAGNNINLGMIKFIVSADIAPLIDREADVVTSVCTSLRERFGSDRRFVVRMLVENMQRCALRGMSPTAIAVASKTSILTRWKALVRSTLNMRLLASVSQASFCLQTNEATERAMDEVAFEAFRDGEEFRSNSGSEEICEVLSQIFQGDMPDALLVRFAGLAYEEGSNSWSHALEKIEETHPGVRKPIINALKLCKEQSNMRGHPAPETLQKLRHILAKR